MLFSKNFILETLYAQVGSRVAKIKIYRVNAKDLLAEMVLGWGVESPLTYRVHVPQRNRAVKKC